MTRSGRLMFVREVSGQGAQRRLFILSVLLTE